MYSSIISVEQEKLKQTKLAEAKRKELEKKK